jgi:hypothetical protein
MGNEPKVIEIDGTDQSHRAFPQEWKRQYTGDGKPPVIIEVETVPPPDKIPDGERDDSKAKG